MENKEQDSFLNILPLKIYSTKFQTTFGSRLEIFCPILISVCLDAELSISFDIGIMKFRELNNRFCVNLQQSLFTN